MLFTRILGQDCHLFFADAFFSTVSERERERIEEKSARKYEEKHMAKL